MNKNKLIPELRFPEFLDEGEWKFFTVENLINQHIEKSEISNQYPVLTSAREGIMFQKDYYDNRNVASLDNSGYNVVPRGYFTYRHMSDDLIFKFNINTICDRGIVSTLYPVFSANENKILPFFLQQKLNEGQEFKNFANSEKQGGSRTYMYLSKLKELKLLIPTIKEQQKIASCLSSLDELLTAHTNKLETLKTYKKGLMQNLFPQDGEKVPKFRFKEFEKDGKWVETKLGNIGNPSMCKRIFKEETTSDSKNGIPFYKIGTFGKEADSYISKEIYEEYKRKYSFPKKGDILISASGTIGRLVVYDGEPAFFQDSNIVWIDNDESKTTNGFLFYAYSLLNWQTSDGGIIQRLYNADLKGMIIRYPKNKQEQQKIADTLSSLDDLIKEQSNKIEQLKLHKKGLMQGLFPKVKK